MIDAITIFIGITGVPSNLLDGFLNGSGVREGRCALPHTFYNRSPLHLF